MQSPQFMQNSTEESGPMPLTHQVTPTTLREPFKRSLEILEDSPTGGLIESLRIISGAATEEELFSDYKLFEHSLHQLLGDQTANTILNFMDDETYSNAVIISNPSSTQ
jgi:hypothetical protein